jgi:hypothetical protein
MKFAESHLQQNCVRYFDYKYPQYRLNLFSIPNEGSRSPANGARMKAQGRRAGVADMMLAVPYKPYHGLFIEFKAGKGKQQESQKEFDQAVTSQGYIYAVITTLDDFITLVDGWLSQK